MRRVDYRRFIKRDNYVAFGKALMDLAESKPGNTTIQSTLKEFRPCSIRKADRSGKFELNRSALYRDGRRYVLKSESIRWEQRHGTFDRAPLNGGSSVRLKRFEE